MNQPTASSVTEHDYGWARVRGSLMSLHLLALSTAVVVHASTTLSLHSGQWGHVILAVLLVPLTFETTKAVVGSSDHVAAQLQLAIGMSLVALGVFLEGLWPSSWVLVIAALGAALLLHGQAATRLGTAPPGPGISSTGS